MSKKKRSENVQSPRYDNRRSDSLPHAKPVELIHRCGRIPKIYEIQQDESRVPPAPKRGTPISMIDDSGAQRNIKR